MATTSTFNLLSATTVNGLTITSTTGTLTLTNGKTLSVSNTLTFTGTDGSTLNIGTGGTLGTSAYITLGTGVGTALAINIGSAGAFVTFNGALGTPSSGTLTNATGLPIVGGTTGTLTAARGGTGLTELPRAGAYKSASDQAITGGAAAAVVVFDVEEYDTGSDFASNAFTVPFTGSCRVSASVYWGGAVSSTAQLHVYVNGAAVKRLGQLQGVANGIIMGGSCLLAVAASDVIDIRAFSDNNQSLTAAQTITWVQFEMGP